jgi:hypothetical protein
MFTKTAKTLLAVLALTSSSVALTSKASAGPNFQQAPSSQEQAWMERASRTTDGGAQ